MTSRVALITDVFSASARARLKTISGLEIQISQTPRPTPDELAHAEILLIRSRTRIGPEQLKMAPQLKLILTSTGGFDHIDFKACERLGIRVGYAPEANVDSAAELTLYFMLALSRRIPEVQLALKRDQWRKGVQRGETLTGRHLGLIGFGRIGRKVAQLAQGFRMRVSACDPYLDADEMKALNVEPLGLSELLVSSDIVSLHVPLTRETKHLINHQTLGVINTDALLINVSRGPVVDEDDLMAALDSGKIKGAGLDVFEREPLIKSSRLYNRPNVILTPHIGAFTESALERACQDTVSQVECYVNERPVPHLLPIPQLWFPLTLSEC